MPCQLPADCLNEVFENLDNDKVTLHSCLLVNRFWCKVSVRILWRNIWSFKYSVAHDRQLKVASAILSTFISCLPNESQEFIHKNEIFISTPTSNLPLFNYASFCKVLSINEVGRIIDEVLKIDQYANTSLRLLDRTYLVAKEILKMFMNQVPSLKSLIYYFSYSINILNNITFTSFPGARDCLTDLSELHCSSDVHSEFFYQLSRICHNLQSLTIYFSNEVSNALKELVSSQNNLKNLELSAYEENNSDWKDIIPALKKHSDTLTNLQLYGDVDRLPLSFISLFSNLQEIKFSLIDGIQFEDFKELQYVTFPKLQTLKFPYKCPKPEYLMKFLEINGKNLKEFYMMDENNNDLNLSIAKFCPNLKKLFVIFNYDDLDTLKTIFNSCQYLEGIVIWCGNYLLNGNEVLEIVAKHSPKNFYELKLQDSKLIPEDLESFFISWKNRASKKPLNLIILDDCNSLKVKEEDMKIIEKYKNLGIIKKFEAREYYYDEEMYL